MEKNFQQQPDLKALADFSGLSEFHFQRIFTRWAGISPKRFIQFLTMENAKQILNRQSVLETAYSVGLSGPGRLHDLFVNVEAVTPGEFKSFGAGLVIRYGFHPTPFGEALIGLTERGICHLSFVQRNRESAYQVLRSNWVQSTLVEDEANTMSIIQPIFMLGQNPVPVSILITGTNFQLKIWEALLKIPRGTLVSYQDVANLIQQPGATRAVGNAIALNPIAFIIPCHRVIQKSGDFGKYRWGAARKKAILSMEMIKNPIQDFR